MKAIVAVDKNWGIGKDNDLLFSIPLDMAFFREQTRGKIVVMGSKTLKSFPNSQPLKNRINIVFHRGNDAYDGAIVVKDLAELSEVLKNYNLDDVFVIGGGSIYKLLLEYCSEALITKVEADGDATVFFPNLDENKDWVLTKTSKKQESNGYTFKFTTYKNNNIKTLRQL